MYVCIWFIPLSEWILAWFTHMTHGSLSFTNIISLWISQHCFSLYTMGVSQKAILKQTLSEAALCRPESFCLKDAVFLDQNSSYDTNMSTTDCQSLLVHDAIKHGKWWTLKHHATNMQHFLDVKKALGYVVDFAGVRALETSTAEIDFCTSWVHWKVVSMLILDHW